MEKVGWPDKKRQISFFESHPSCVGFVAESREKVVGAAFGAANGVAGWIGLVFVSPEFRGRGLGSSLTHSAMNGLQSLGCRSFLLVATEMGRPLYESLGFSFETNYHGFVVPGNCSKDVGGFRPVSPENLNAVLRLDRSVMGEDRGRIIEAMPRGWMLAGANSEVRAHHFAAPWGGGSAVASDFEAGKSVVEFQRSLVGSESSVRVWLTDENVQGREYMVELGGREFRVSPRMVAGESVERSPEGLWGVFSLAKG